MGRAIAHRFANAGDKVYILGRRLERLEDTAKGHPTIHCLKCDVTDVESIEKAKDAILVDDKKVDVLINNAGGNIKVDPDVSPKDARAAWHKIIDTNLTSVFNMVFAYEHHITRPGGRIINITSMAALAGSRQGGIPGQAYSAAKAGIHGLSRTLVHSFAPHQITVNCIAPGVIDQTEYFHGRSVPNELADFYKPKIPIARLGTPEDIAGGAFYLASGEASYITGEILNINGGIQFGR